MRHRLLVPATLLAASALLWLVASNFRRGVGQYDTLGPSFFPKLILLGLAVVSLWDLALSVHQRKPGVAGEALGRGSQETLGENREPRQGRSFYWTDLFLATGLTIAYVALLPYVGFLTGSLLFQFGLLFCVFRQRRRAVVLGGPIVLTFLLFVIFGIGMGIALPRGQGVFLTMSRFLY